MSPSPIRFGSFELDLEREELFQTGVPIRLRPQALKVLAYLAAHRGRLVTRDELREVLWSPDTFVDFEQGLNFCIRQIRIALHDDANEPKFIETVPRRGYRFIATDDATPAVAANAPKAAPAPATLAPATTKRKALRVASVLVVLALTAAVVFIAIRHRTPAARAGRIMVAVVPFDNLSGDPAQDYFSDGITEELLTEIGHLNPDRLGVIARRSVEQYKRHRDPISRIGRQLSVDYVVEGSARHAGDRVRIAAQLIRVSDESHVWAAEYDRPLIDVLELQRQIAFEIARKIDITASSDFMSRHQAVDNAAAYEAYLQGRYYWNERTAESLRQGLALFQKATQFDPKDARAWSGVADCFSQLYNYQVLDPKQALPQAQAAVSRALSLDPKSAEAHASAGYLQMIFHRDVKTAETELQRAVQLDANYATAHLWYGLLLAQTGRFQEATSQFEQAHASDPLSPIMNNALSLPAYYARDWDQLIERSQRALLFNSSSWLPHQYLGLGYVGKGLPGRALPEFEIAVRLSAGNPDALSSLAYVYAKSHRRSEAQRILAQLLARSEHEYVSPGAIAVIYASLGDNDRAYEYLSKEVASGRWMSFVNPDPRLDSVRSDSRFKKLLNTTAN